MPLTFENRHTPIWQIHYYRSEYGDGGYKATPHFEQPDGEELKDLLLDRFANPKRRIKPPISADVVDDDGNVVMRAHMISQHEAEIFPLPKRSS